MCSFIKQRMLGDEPFEVHNKQCILDDGSLINPDLDRRTEELRGTLYGERLIDLRDFRWRYVERFKQELMSKHGKTMEQLAAEKGISKTDLVREISAEAEIDYMKEYLKKQSSNTED